MTEQPPTEQQGFTVWFTGLSGSGKSTIAEMLYPRVPRARLKTEILDGDEVRKNLSKGLGFSKEDRDTNILRIGFVADLLTRNGVATICCPISPYKETRDACRELIGEFVEVHVDATVDEIAANRDPKGLYKKALAGEITGFTGVDDPYEAPEDPEIHVDTLRADPRGVPAVRADAPAGARPHRRRRGARHRRPGALGAHRSAGRRGRHGRQGALGADRSGAQRRSGVSGPGDPHGQLEVRREEVRGQEPRSHPMPRRVAELGGELSSRTSRVTACA